jgi:hypothetical protein
MGREEDLTGYLRGHRAIAQDEVREDREHRSARRALKPPDGDATEADAEEMGVTRQASRMVKKLGPGLTAAVALQPSPKL